MRWNVLYCELHQVSNFRLELTFCWLQLRLIKQCTQVVPWEIPRALCDMFGLSFWTHTGKHLDSLWPTLVIVNSILTNRRPSKSVQCVKFENFAYISPAFRCSQAITIREKCTAQSVLKYVKRTAHSELCYKFIPVECVNQLNPTSSINSYSTLREINPTYKLTFTQCQPPD